MIAHVRPSCRLCVGSLARWLAGRLKVGHGLSCPRRIRIQQMSVTATGTGTRARPWLLCYRHSTSARYVFPRT